MLNDIYCHTPAHKAEIRKEILDIHGEFQQLTEADFYPEHRKRKESSEYRKVHQEIISKHNAGCVVCGVTESILSDPEKKKDKAINYYQATQMELHHHHIEWALANAIDVDKFNKLLKVHLARLHPECQMYKTFMDQATILAWIDHRPHNLMPLCDVHHRHKYYGIHKVSYPNWTAANLYRDDFIKSIQERISE